MRTKDKSKKGALVRFYIEADSTMCTYNWHKVKKNTPITTLYLGKYAFDFCRPHAEMLARSMDPANEVFDAKQDTEK
jgi:hypothetical protein